MPVQMAQRFDREIERYCARLDCVSVETLRWLVIVSPTMLEGKPSVSRARKHLWPSTDPSGIGTWDFATERTGPVSSVIDT